MTLKNIKVLHAPSSVGGNSQTLSRALNKIGITSYSLVVSQNYLHYKADIVLHRPGGNYVLRELKRFWALIYLFPKFDIIHYNAGTTLFSAYDFNYQISLDMKMNLRFIYSRYLIEMQKLELKWLKFLGKKIFITYQGDDARQGDYSLRNFSVNIASQVDAGYYDAKSDAFKRRNINLLNSAASQIYAVNPDLLHVLTDRARFMPYSTIFMDEWVPKYNLNQTGPLKIVHAPSNRKVKGTDLILNTLEKLKSDGFEFELIMVEGMSNIEAKLQYERADVLIDQLYAGWYGGLAVELMALGKPVMVYLRDEDLKLIPEEMRAELPFIRTSPDLLGDSLRNLLQMSRADILDVGRKSRCFVERWHDPIKIAHLTKLDYEAALNQIRE